MLTKLRRRSNFFFRLILSYILLLVLAVVLVGYGSYLQFTEQYNEQVQQVNERILSQWSATIDMSIVQKAESIYLGLVTDSFQNSDLLHLFTNTADGQYTKIRNVQSLLSTAAATAPDIVESVDMYVLGSSLRVSSLRGVTYGNDPASDSKQKLEWITTAAETGPTSLWLLTDAETRLAGQQPAKRLTFLRPYPLVADRSKQRGFIAIHMHAQLIDQLIANKSSNDESSTLLLDASGKVLASSAPFLPSEGWDDMVSRIVNEPQPSLHQLVDLGGQATIAGYQTLPYYGWRLVSFTPVEEFYSKGRRIRNNVLFTSLAVIAIGLLLAHIFASRFYNPVRTIVTSARAWLEQDHAEVKRKENSSSNEFLMINEMIGGLSVQVNELQRTLSSNLPVMKHNFVYGLLLQGYTSNEEVSARLKLLRSSFPFSRYTAVQIQLPPQQMIEMDTETREFVKFYVMGKAEEQLSHDTMRVMAADLPGDIIGIVVNLEEPAMSTLAERCQDLVSVIYANFMVEATVLLGSTVESALALPDSYKQTEKLSSYLYYLPRVQAVYEVELLRREESQEEIPEELVDSFAKSLRSRQPEVTEQALLLIIEHMAKGSYSLHHCEQRWSETINAFYGYLKEMNFRSKDIVSAYMQEELKEVKHIVEFQQLLFRMIVKTWTMLEKKSNDRTYEVVDRVKSYIEEQYHMPLSLDYLADLVQTSPRYLSKIFKDETGMNFVDYLNSVRMDRAKELLLTTELTVEDISSKTGFNSSAYFIRKFREAHGTTPKMFRQMQQ
ncbi:AraC family transcriptional regulator [Paenibacillus sp. F411]|uniref:AraC family transcriptional regulator n=1 Tax=Paenibacillus sp. F411 TaxID=2820239 RepID=UPI001AAEEE58|nr:AraC family transcriptional regulator [Paenibacillus sp. F411]MBO2945437.1 AraC family transcriptional regulator [Paenibacillus sp. F411]